MTMKRRKPISEKQREHIKRMHEAWKGKNHSEETKRKMSECQKGRPRSEKQKEHLRRLHDARRGHKWGHLSEEAKRKISEANKGKHRSEETRERMSEAKKGENNPRWNNGLIFNRGGYVLVRMPSHPKADPNGYVHRSVLVWTSHFGPIPPGCVIHHINGDKTDDRIENLMMLSNSGHSGLHAKVKNQREAGKDPEAARDSLLTKKNRRDISSNNVEDGPPSGETSWKNSADGKTAHQGWGLKDREQKLFFMTYRRTGEPKGGLSSGLKRPLVMS